MLLVFSSIDGFVLKLLLHVYMGSKCSISLYKAFQMEDKSCKGPIYFWRTSFYLQTEVKLGMIKLKHSLSTHKPGSPGQPLQIQVVLISFPPLVFFPLAVQTLHFFTLDLASFHSAGVSLWLASGFSLLAWLCCQLLLFSLVFLILVH